VSEFDPPAPYLRDLVANALAEDFGLLGDITSLACIDADAKSDGAFVAREAGVIAGIAAATEVFRQVDANVLCSWEVADGDACVEGTTLGRLHGPTRSLLGGERLALNLLSHCSGIATLTRRCVTAAGDGTRILDTRKTLPGLRALQRAAVRAGGGVNHRDSLSGAVLIKDNHLAGGTITDAVQRARAMWPGRIVEIECDTLEQVDEARAAGADVVLLDNMAPAQVQDAVRALGGACLAEVSGGVTLDSLPAFARARPDFISLGALTHSVPALDIGLDLA
jgi:nicotinate-nucleotide pyrophosphorylase (carboxylating)